jgi:hypothetical protein
MKNLRGLLVVSMALFFTNCVNNGCDYGISICWVEYNIKLGYESDPPIRDIAVGDTFMITMEIPDIVTDSETGVTYDIADLDYSKTFSIDKMDIINKTFKPAPLDSFEYINIDGKGSIEVVQLEDFVQVVRLKLDYVEDKKIVSFKVVPKTDGIYFGHISFTDKNLEEVDNVKIDLTDTCCLERINLTHEYFSDNNIDLIPDITNWGVKHDGWDTSINHQDLDSDELTKYGLFFFRVND